MDMKCFNVKTEDHPKKKKCRGTPPRPVTQKTLDGKAIAHYISICEAAKSVYGDRASISKACRGKLKTAYGFLWEYRDKGTEKAKGESHA